MDTLFDDVCGSACRSRARSCPQREIDFGGCRCQAALLTGDEGSTDPVCSLSPRRRVVDDILGKLDGSDNFSKWMPRRNPTNIVDGSSEDCSAHDAAEALKGGR